MSETRRITLITLILIVAVNLLIFLGYRVDVWIEAWTRDPEAAADNVIVERHDVPLDAVYPDMDGGEIDAMLGEIWSRGMTHDADAFIREAPFSGRYVNVDEAGFRHSQDQSPWPPADDRPVVFVFGGSTTFGYGLPDDQTVVSHLARLIRGTDAYADAQIYNFARGFYFSTMEQRIFTGLVGRGIVPDLAIFIDGLNEFAFTGESYPGEGYLQACVHQSAAPEGGQSLIEIDFDRLGHHIPMVRLARDLNAPPSTPAPTDGDGEQAFDGSVYNDPSVLQGVIDRYLRQQRLIHAIAEAHEVRSVFVWQPVPTYAYDLSHHLFAGSQADGHTSPMFNDHNYSAFGYPMMAAQVADSPPDGEFIWCADISEDAERPLYVDAVHYTAEMSDMLAQCIWQGMNRTNPI